MGITAAGVAAAAAVASVGVSAYGAKESANMQEDAAKEQELLRAQAEEEALRVENQTLEEIGSDTSATVKFGTPDDEDDEVGTYDDFLTIPAVSSTTGLNTGTTNFSSASGLTV